MICTYAAVLLVFGDGWLNPRIVETKMRCRHSIIRDVLADMVVF